MRGEAWEKVSRISVSAHLGEVCVGGEAEMRHVPLRGKIFVRQSRSWSRYCISRRKSITWLGSKNC